MKRHSELPSVTHFSRHQRRSCKRKEPYRNLALAQLVAAKASERACDTIVAYKCLFREQFHIGHPGRKASVL
jgi:hypothetical protein